MNTWIKTLALAALTVGSPLWAEDSPEASPRTALPHLKTFIEVFDHISRDYVDSVDTKTLIDAAIDGMLDTLDPHSAYLPPADVSDLRESTSGSFGGIGIEMDVVNGLIEVIAPIDGSPAARAGIEARDLITAIDGEAASDLSLREAIEMLRGPVGEPITLEILRANDGQPETLTMTLERAVIEVTSVTEERFPHGIGYIRISQFQHRTGADVIRAITRLTDDGAPKGVILDLRNNPGGVLTAAIDVADAFLSEGTIVSTKGRDDLEDITYEASPDALVADSPMIVLINGGSASASEIVAGALQDHGRAVILGSPSFGKGSVQTIMPLENTYALKLTTALYFTPNGRSIQATGIQPTMQVAGGESVIESDAHLRESDLPQHLENTVQDTDHVELLARFKEDNQLLHAFNLLRGAQLLAR